MAKDYAIVPEKEIIQLKQEVDSIRKNPFQAYGTENFVDSINNLTKAINSLIDLFKTAADEMKLEERETETIGKKVEPMFTKMDTLVGQNEKIARGILAIADMMEERMKQPVAAPRPVTNNLGDAGMPAGPLPPVSSIPLMGPRPPQPPFRPGEMRISPPPSISGMQASPLQNAPLSNAPPLTGGPMPLPSTLPPPPLPMMKKKKGFFG